MSFMGKQLNLVLSGGGIKGISYVGMFEVAKRNGVRWGNLAGVSAGAVATAYLAAGYNPCEMKKVMTEFDFEQLGANEIGKKAPIVERYIQFNRKYRSSNYTSTSVRNFLNAPISNVTLNRYNFSRSFLDTRGNILKNIAIYANEGCLFDGDILQEWFYDVLKCKGIRTFGDLRGGIVDKVNPNGYKVRMTAVDVNRGKVIVLPDDMKYYGIDPDEFEVATAIRMSTSVPFAFKPVGIKFKKGKKEKTNYIVDGGVLDNCPSWLIEGSYDIPLVGFRLDYQEPKKVNTLDSPLSILKLIISAVHDLGIPKVSNNCSFYGYIDTQKVSFLDFNLSEEDKEYLYNSGKTGGVEFFQKYRV